MSVSKTELKFTIEFAVSKQLFLARCDCLNISHTVAVPEKNGTNPEKVPISEIADYFANQPI